MTVSRDADCPRSSFVSNDILSYRLTFLLCILPQNHITVDGFKASRADLIEMLKEIADSELLPDIALTLKITALMQQNVR